MLAVSPFRDVARRGSRDAHDRRTTTNVSASNAPKSDDSDRPDPEALPRQQRVRYDALVDAAYELLEHGEYDHIKMHDVAKSANMALATLYRYFSSKEHLYAAVLFEWAKSFRALTPKNPDAAGAEGLSEAMRRAIRAFERKPQMLRAEIALEGTTDPNARAVFSKFGFQNYKALSQTLPGRSRAETDAIVETVNCVLSIQLRSWALGLCSIDYVYRAVQRSIDLIFAPERLRDTARDSAPTPALETR